MIESTVSLQEQSFPSVEVNRISDTTFRVRAAQVELPFGVRLPFLATVEKLPIVIENGRRMHDLSVDIGSPVLDPLKREAEALKQLPAEQRPRKLVELVRAHVDYPYESVLARLQREQPESYSWVKEKLEKGEAALSECVSHGFGKCGHLALLAAYLGSLADLEATVATYGPTTPEHMIRNVLRNDTGQPLFKSIPPEHALTVGHGWAEFLMPDGEWMPADVATQLVGDTEEGRETFQKANYFAPLHGIVESGLPPELVLDVNLLAVRPGEGKKTAEVSVRGVQLWKKKQWTKPNYSGQLDFEIRNIPTLASHLPVRLLEVQPALV